MQKSDTRQRTVLVIDDDDTVRDSLCVLLQARDYSVADFASAQDFLARRDSLHGDCLLLDIHMPGMTGIELIKALRERGDSIPAILITGRTDASIQAQAKSVGASALLDKPVATARLFAAIEEAIASAGR
jgi:two-component system response regulator FixJ